MATKKARRDSKGYTLQKGESQKANGSYIYQYTANGVRKSFCADSLDALRVKEKQLQQDLTDGIRLDASQMTLNQLYERYMRGKEDIRGTTKYNNMKYWRTAISETLGQKTLGKLHQSDIQAWVNDMRKEGHTYLSTAQALRLVKSALIFGVRDDYIRKNVADGVRVPGKPNERFALTVDQQHSLLEYARQSKVYRVHAPWIQFLIETGLRASEMCGLIWEDINLTEGILTIQRQLLYTGTTDDNSAHYFVAPPKTASGERIIALTPAAVGCLKEWREIYVQLGRRCTVEIDGVKNFVFFSSAGTPYTTRLLGTYLKNLINAYNKKHVEKLEHISPHYLRHTCATNLHRQGVDAQTAAAMLGHKNIQITGHYTHVGIDKMRMELQKMESENENTLVKDGDLVTSAS